MADQSVVSNPEWWERYLAGGGLVIGAIGAGYNFIRAKIAKRHRTPAPVGWEDALMELRRDMVAGFAAASRVSNETSDQVRRLRDHDLALQKTRMERLETDQAQDREATSSILDRILDDLRLLKRRLVPELSKDPNRIPE